jgi:hypothetical protein
LPAASLFALAIDKSVDILGDDDEPYDVKMAYQNYLRSMLGDTVGDVVSRGLPRALGFDVSQRLGEADIIPLTRLLTDRRDWKEASQDWALSTLGSPVSMLFSIAGGGAKLAAGDVMGGMKDMVPQAIKGPIEAYKMYDTGYTDAKGNGMPLTPGALDILYQSIGLKPAEKANYDERKLAYTAKRGQMMRITKQYRKELAMAIESGNMSKARELAEEIRGFDERNPAYAILPTMGGTLASRARERQAARASNTPLGVKSELADQYGLSGSR